MTRRTDPADSASCALVLAMLVDQVRAHPVAPMLIAQRPELKHVFDAATAALAGVELERIRCEHPIAPAARRCGWVGLFPVRNPDGFRCARCRGDRGEALP